MKNKKMKLRINIPSSLLRAFIPSVFKSDNGCYVADSRTLTGLVICALVRSRVQQPVSMFPTPGDDSYVEFAVPKHMAGPMWGKELYLTKGDTQIINRALRREFNVTFTEYWVSYVSSGMTVTDTVSSFIFDYKLDDHYMGDVDALQKRIIRYRLDSVRGLKKRLRRNYYYKKRLLGEKKQ